jgi:DNA invertase Pin-like site-specific DNA recombinase
VPLSIKAFLYGQWYDERMRRAAIYARVSTVDGRQDPETQLRQLREYAERHGFPVAHEYVDHASGAKNDRAEYRAMLEAARRRQFDVLLVWRYDRFVTVV